MPLLKRKPVLMHPLPSLSAIVQPVHPPQASAGQTSTPGAESSPNAVRHPTPADLGIPSDGNDDEEQLEKLLTALNDPTIAAAPPKRGQKANGVPNGTANGAISAAQQQLAPGAPIPGYRVKNVDVFYIPETGEMFLDYESFAARRAFYEQPLFQCEVSGKSSLSYFKALQNESREVRQLHARFPRQLKKAVLQSVQFQVEGKLETLADKVFERFVNRFFDDEKVFVDVQGDKYLARVVRTFPPKNMVLPPDVTPPAYHFYATDLHMPNEEVAEIDDPMKYFYQVRLIEEGTDGDDGDDVDGKGEKWQGSVMEVQADKISRDRINFSRAMLKRFIRDCVHRDAAIYSPWMVKKPVAQRYGLPTEMSDQVREAIALYRERQMDKRKRDREERLGITHSDEEVEEETEKPAKKKRTKKERKEDEKKEEEEPKEEEEQHKRKKATKYPCEDLLVEFSLERDGTAGRIEVRPTPNKQMPFGEQFEKFLMSWSFLNVMGKPLGLSAFTIDDYEQALYHTDPYTAPVPLMVEIHAVLLNALIRDYAATREAVRPLAHCGMVVENDTDYWEGTKGATTDTLRPVAVPLAETWKDKELSSRDNRKGWESALVGMLWERATLDTLPQYLDNILYLTFEDKPAPTRPTWSTGPSSGGGQVGLIAAKPDKRYTSLHFVHKLNILAFLIELVSQTASIREFMEDATSALTEVRKEQIEARREWRRIRAERDALEPKPEKPGKEGEEGEGDGDVTMEVKDESASHPATPNGHANGTATNTEMDELEGGSMMDDAQSLGSSPLSDAGARAKSGVSRRKAMKEKAEERAAEEAEKVAKAAKERAEERAKKAETKHASAEKKRLADEEEALEAKLRQLEIDFRRHLYTLRTRPLGTDRYGNKVWFLDGLGSSPLYVDGGSSGKLNWGTARLYLQGADDLEVEFCRAPAELPEDELKARREKEEGESRLAPGQWGFYDTPEQLAEFVSWLNPRGQRETHLARALKTWGAELEGGMHRRRIALGLEIVPEADNEPARRVRPTRRAAGDEEREGYLAWRNRRAPGRD